MTQPPQIGQNAPPSTVGADLNSQSWSAPSVTAARPDSPTGPPVGAASAYGPPVTVSPTPAAGNGTHAPTTSSRAGRSRGPRRARLQLRHINPWTVLKFSCVLAIALFFVWMIVIGVLYGILDAAGAIGKINNTVTTIDGPGSKSPVTAGIVFGGAAIIGAVNIILFIAISTVGSVVYNLCADLVGGIEITLSER